MAGGIFVDQPFHFNLKCVVFGGVLAAGYWATAVSGRAPSLIMVAAIMISAYIALAWYDHIYRCDPSKRLLTGRNGIVGYVDSIFKPQNTESNSNVLEPNEQCREYTRHVWIFQGLVTGPLLLYLAWANSSISVELSLILTVLGASQAVFGLAHF